MFRATWAKRWKSLSPILAEAWLALVKNNSTRGLIMIEHQRLHLELAIQILTPLLEWALQKTLNTYNLLHCLHLIYFFFSFCIIFFHLLVCVYSLIVRVMAYNSSYLRSCSHAFCFHLTCHHLILSVILLPMCNSLLCQNIDGLELVKKDAWENLKSVCAC